MGLEDMPYDIPNVRAEQCRAYAHTRVGWYRSVSNIPRAFAIQSITAELAHELARDDKDFLSELIGAPRKLDWQGGGLAQPDRHTGEPNEHLPIDTRRPHHVTALAPVPVLPGMHLAPAGGHASAAHR